jgi:ferritin-like metal-binding protein YciE
MSLKEVLLDEMRDLYSAENQLVKALPKTLKAVSDEEMKQLLTNHLDETKKQVERLQQIFDHLSEKPTGKHCNGMEGCIKEVSEALEEDEEGALKDAGIVGASLRTEHYEIAGYSAAIAMAKVLKEQDIIKLLTESLQEEQSAAKEILSRASAVLKAANAQEDEDDDQEDDEEGSDKQESEEQNENDGQIDRTTKKSTVKRSTAKK